MPDSEQAGTLAGRVRPCRDGILGACLENFAEPRVITYGICIEHSIIRRVRSSF